MQNKEFTENRRQFNCTLFLLLVVDIPDTKKQLYALNMLVLVLPAVNRNMLLVSAFFVVSCL